MKMKTREGQGMVRLAKQRKNGEKEAEKERIGRWGRG